MGIRNQRDYRDGQHHGRNQTQQGGQNEAGSTQPLFKDQRFCSNHQNTPFHPAHAGDQGLPASGEAAVDFFQPKPAFYLKPAIFHLCPHFGNLGKGMPQSRFIFWWRWHFSRSDVRQIHRRGRRTIDRASAFRTVVIRPLFSAGRTSKHMGNAIKRYVAASSIQ